MKYEVSRYNVSTGGREVLSLWEKVLPGIGPERFPWIYRNNPDGKAVCIVARVLTEQVMVGMTSLFPRRLSMNGDVCAGAIVGDFAVEKEHRGFGPAIALQLEAVSVCKSGDFRILYSVSPDQVKLVMQRAGYLEVGRGIRAVRLLSLSSYLRGRLGLICQKLVSPLADLMLKVASGEVFCPQYNEFDLLKVKQIDSRFNALLDKINRRAAIIVKKTVEYLNWRFIERPGGGYEIFALADRRNDELVGCIIGNRNYGEFAIADLMVADEEKMLGVMITKLVRQLSSEKVEGISITYYGSQTFVKMLREYGFICRGQSSWLVAYANTPELVRQMTCLDNWHLFSGDNDV